MDELLSVSLAQLQHEHPALIPSRCALIAVSGGRDSMALLHLLATRGWNKLVVCHLNHALRGRASTADAALVLRTAKKLGLRCETEKVDVAAASKRDGISVELAGRRARDDFFSRMARRHRTRFVFLAHHADDQAETVLGNLFRGGGLAGLAGMLQSAESDDGKLIKLRPLLDARRGEITKFVNEQRIAFHEDASNESAEHRRNRIRHEVLPLLCDVFGRDVCPIVLRVAETAARDHAAMEVIAHDSAKVLDLFTPDRALRVTDEFRRAHAAIQSRILRHFLWEVHHCPGIHHAVIEAAMAMLQPGGPARINLPGGRWLRRTSGRLWVQAEGYH